MVGRVSCSLARAPGPDQKSEVGGTDGAVPVDVRTGDDRSIGVPCGDQKPEIRGIDFAILIKIPRAWGRRRFAVVT